MVFGINLFSMISLPHFTKKYVKVTQENFPIFVSDEPFLEVPGPFKPELWKNSNGNILRLFSRYSLLVQDS